MKSTLRTLARRALCLAAAAVGCAGDNPATADATSAAEAAVDLGPEATPADAPADVSDAEAAVVERSVFAKCEAADAGPSLPALVTIGHDLVVAQHCQQCHGADLSGNFTGVMFVGHRAPAYPPNLTPDRATGLGCWTDEEISRAILDGVDDEGMALCPPMPHFSENGVLDAADALAIVQYLRSLRPAQNQVPDTPECALWGETGGGCATSADCHTGDVCNYQFCTLATLIDAGGVADVGGGDARMSDGGGDARGDVPADGARPDGARSDVGATDALDAGGMDAGAMDAGAMDAGAMDARADARADASAMDVAVDVVDAAVDVAVEAATDVTTDAPDDVPADSAPSDGDPDASL